MRIVLYLHSSKESGLEAGEKAGLTGEALSLFKYAGNEHKIEYEVDEQGNAVAVTIDGREIAPEK